MQPLVVLDVVGLTSRQLGERTPNLLALAQRGAHAPMSTILPAVTCSAQATMLTGALPSDHGAVGNGWMEPATREVALWRQPNGLVAGEKLYEVARGRIPGFRCAKLFWWWNLGAAVDLSITPRPFYPADGRKILAVYSDPPEFGEATERDLGPFPFFEFWGPRSGLGSSRWIARATLRTLSSERPHLTLAYLPHLDYDHQRYGPDDPRSLEALSEIDRIVGEVAEGCEREGARLVVVSEYGISAVDRPIEVNRALRAAGLLAVRETPTGDVLDPFRSHAFALADHQVAHVYARQPTDALLAREVLSELPGVALVLDRGAQREYGIDHPRSGDFVLVAERGAWFTYPYWPEGGAEPDFARTIDIHRKPGYDPCELFVDPALRFPRLGVASFLLRKKLGLRALLRVVPLDPTLVRGSHGRLPEDPLDGPVFLSSGPWSECGGEPANGVVTMTSVKSRLLELLRHANA